MIYKGSQILYPFAHPLKMYPPPVPKRVKKRLAPRVKFDLSLLKEYTPEKKQIIHCLEFSIVRLYSYFFTNPLTDSRVGKKASQQDYCPLFVLVQSHPYSRATYQGGQGSGMFHVQSRISWGSQLAQLSTDVLEKVARVA